MAPYRLYACLLAVALTAGAMPTLAGSSPRSTAMDAATTPLACVDKACPDVATACDAMDRAAIGLPSQGQDACSRSKGCGSPWRTWDVRGDFASGSGEVHFFVSCGHDGDGRPREVVHCNALDQTGCQSGEGGDKGDFGCFYEVLHGNPGAVTGKCVDPTNPTIVYRAIRAGLPYDMTDNLLPA